MTFTIRGIELDDPEAYKVTPTTSGVAVSGEITAPTLPAAKARRQQLEGLIRRQGVESVVWTEDPSVDGAYRVAGGDTETPVFGLIGFTFLYSLQLERLPHHQSIRTYGSVDSRQRTGAPGGTTEDPWLAVPSTVLGADLAGVGAVPYTRTGPGVSKTCRFYVDPALSATVASWRSDPGAEYDMSPELQIDGYQVIGDSIEQPATASGWVATNQIISAQGTTNASYTFDLYCPQGATPANSGAVVHHITVGLWLASTLVVLRPDRVMLSYLDADSVVVDLVGYVSTPATGDDYEVACSLAIRRGSHHFELQTRSNVSAVHVLMVNETMAEITAGNTSRVTADDGDHNRLLAASGTGWTTFTGALGRHRTAATNVADWCLGVELNGTSAVAPNTAAETFDHYWADMTIDLEEGP